MKKASTIIEAFGIDVALATSDAHLLL